MAGKKTTATIEDGMLVIRTPVGKPTASASGKTLVLASSRGNHAFGEYEGKELIVGFNAYVYPTAK